MGTHAPNLQDKIEKEFYFTEFSDVKRHLKINRIIAIVYFLTATERTKFVFHRGFRPEPPLGELTTPSVPVVGSKEGSSILPNVQNPLDALILQAISGYVTATSATVKLQ